MTAPTLATHFTAQDMRYLGHSVYSSVIQSFGIIITDDNDLHLLVLFTNSETVYRYAFRSHEDARNWDYLRRWSEEEDADPISWGSAFNRFLREGALMPITA